MKPRNLRSPNGAADLSKSAMAVVLGFTCLALCPSTDIAVVADAAGPSQRSERQSDAAIGTIAGIVVDERQGPVSRAQVLAFSTRTHAVEAQGRNGVPFSAPASGSASTDDEGRILPNDHRKRTRRAGVYLDVRRDHNKNPTRSSTGRARVWLRRERFWTPNGWDERQFVSTIRRVRIEFGRGGGQQTREVRDFERASGLVPADHRITTGHVPEHS